MAIFVALNISIGAKKRNTVTMVTKPINDAR